MARESSSKGTTIPGTLSTSKSARTPNTQSSADRDSQDDILLRSQGQDHTISYRQRLSLRHYPPDYPPPAPRWYYAIDSPKWKPSLSEQKRKDSKPLPPPKKFVPFTSKDSQSIEHAFQELCNFELKREQTQHGRPIDKTRDEPVKVPVNEDYLFDVNINQRELGPAYWIGPVYEVRRGTWFYQEGSTIRPCEENLATQLEEGYLKVKPWRSDEIRELVSHALPAATTRSEQDVIENTSTTPANELRKHRLFGSYMNNIVTYQDSTTALLTSDDFMSRMSTTVFQTLGAVSGTRLVRGFVESKKPSDAQDKRSSDQKSASEPPSTDFSTNATSKRKAEPSNSALPQEKPPIDATPSETRPITTLERRLSSLAGAQDSVDLEEQARKQEEQEMEDSREADDEDRLREIDHLVLVTHGIGQRLGLRLESLNFIHDVNLLRKTMKRVYKNSLDLQALNSSFPDKGKNCRVQVIPVCWRHLLDFPYKRVGKNRRELDLADADSFEDDIYPSLSDITLESVPAVRNLISDLAIDVLLYQSKYRQRISAIVREECNRIVELYRARNPQFKGTVSLCGHSLGSAILFDILCSENMDAKRSAELGEKAAANPNAFTFDCEEFFCLGSPIALFEMLKGNIIAGRPLRKHEDGNEDDIANSDVTAKRQSAGLSAGLAMGDDQFAVSVPKCGQLYNIFHPSDPVSYRMEPLISPAMSSLKPQPLPSVKRSIWNASGQSLSLIGSRVGQSVGSLWTNFTSGVASSLLNRSLGITPEETPPQPNSSTRLRSQQRFSPPRSFDDMGDRSPTLIDTDIETLYEGYQKAKVKRETEASDPEEVHDTGLRELDRGLKKLKLEDEKVRLLNSNGRVDYSIQEGAFDISLIASLASHLTYWSDEDVNHFMLSQMLCRKRAPSRD
ncbi:DDHD domain-containing protein [Aspergillus karnatakaensis]|uniref:DDHD family phospholipase n=1 Tax=Aspergillus karnatakaensis TaxID=1810916 RepID=UPI003CCDD947